MNSSSTGSATRRRRTWLLYPLWILLCGLLFAALLGAPDPARPAGRLTEKEGIAKAEAALKSRPGFDSHRVVHAAWSPKGELGGESRWVVLFRAVEAQGLQSSVVVEVTGDEGRLIRMRGVGGE
ncbi:MAG TPA: hypothetical protein VMS12_11040 [Thermoanaerobaculia bacterium]|nr:hypothetical protein [Thermoanaerobaculia bacterium]